MKVRVKATGEIMAIELADELITQLKLKFGNDGN